MENILKKLEEIEAKLDSIKNTTALETKTLTLEKKINRFKPFNPLFWFRLFHVGVLFFALISIAMNNHDNQKIFPKLLNLVEEHQVTYSERMVAVNELNDN